MGGLAKGPSSMNELEAMGALLGEPLEVTRGETVDLPVPARAEIVIEGVVDPVKWGAVTDGPFGEYMGYIGEGNFPCYLTHVTAITMRRDAIYHDLDNGHADHLNWLLFVLGAGVYDTVQRAVPTVRAVNFASSVFPGSSAIWVAYISIKKRIPGEGRLAGLAALTLQYVRMAVVVDEDIDVYNEREALWALFTRVNPELDILINPRMPSSMAEPGAYDETGMKRGYLNTSLLIDATKPVEKSFATRIIPPKDLWDSMNLDDYLKT